MKVFLGNAPWYKEGHFGVRAGSRWPHLRPDGDPYMPFPFFIGYAAALLEKNNVDVCIIDGIAERISTDAFFQKIEDYNPDLILFEVSTPSFQIDTQMIRRAREQFDGAKIVLCGPHYDMFKPEFFENSPEVDFVIEGEYEFALLELTQALESGGGTEKILGLYSRDHDGKGRANGKRPLAELTEFPWPARQHLPMLNYHDNPTGMPEPTLQMWASRGCPFQCIFCVWPQIMYGGSKYRMRDAKDVVKEIKHCVEEYRMKSIYFDDDTFNIGRNRMFEFCDEFIKEGLNQIPWSIMARADTIDPKIWTRMREAGLQALKFGVESGNQQVIKNSGKRLDLDRVRQSVRITRDLGIKSHLTFMFGLPGETKETVIETIEFAKELNPDSLQFSIATPFPGSSYYNDLDQKGYILSKNWNDYDGNSTAVIKTDSMSNANLEEALQYAHTEWDQWVAGKTRKNGGTWTWENLKLGLCNLELALRKVRELVTIGR